MLVPAPTADDHSSSGAILVLYWGGGVATDNCWKSVRCPPKGFQPLKHASSRPDYNKLSEVRCKDHSRDFPPGCANIFYRCSPTRLANHPQPLLKRRASLFAQSRYLIHNLQSGSISSMVCMHVRNTSTYTPYNLRASLHVHNPFFSFCALSRPSPSTQHRHNHLFHRVGKMLT